MSTRRTEKQVEIAITEITDHIECLDVMIDELQERTKNLIRSKKVLERLKKNQIANYQEYYGKNFEEK